MNRHPGAQDSYPLVPLTYLASTAFPLLGAGGLWLARTRYRAADQTISSHLRYQQTTMIITSLLFLAAVVVPSGLAGLALLAANWLWWIRRSLRGLMAWVENNGAPGPDKWEQALAKRSIRLLHFLVRGLIRRNRPRDPASYNPATAFPSND